MSITKCSKLVDKDKYILSRIIDAIRFHGALELVLRGHDESEDSDNHGLFKGLINYTAALDTLLKDHWKTALF